MQYRERGLSENGFRYLRRTEMEIDAIPDTLKQKFQPYLQLIQSSRKFMPDVGTRRFDIGNVAHDTKVSRRKDRSFSFYAKFEETLENRSIELRTDSNYSRVEAIEVLSHKLNNEGGIIGSIWNRIDLIGGTYVEQQVEPIPMDLQDKSYNKQKFVLNTRDSTLASLKWCKNGEEFPIVEITLTGETIFLAFEQTITDHRTGERLIKGPEGTIRLPHPDEFIAQAIKNVINLEPLSFA